MGHCLGVEPLMGVLGVVGLVGQVGEFVAVSERVDMLNLAMGCGVGVGDGFQAVGGQVLGVHLACRAGV